LLSQIARQLCDAPYVTQDAIEGQVVAILRAVALPPNFSVAVTEAAKELARSAGPSRHLASVKELGRRLDRLKLLFELGDLETEEYMPRRGAVQAELEDAKSRPQPV
jgi:hypothetical protein